MKKSLYFLTFAQQKSKSKVGRSPDFSAQLKVLLKRLS